jgi:hypothetical protein
VGNADIDGPMFRPLRRNRRNQEARRAMNPDAVDRVVRKFVAKIGLDRGYSAHSMRATFITTVLENGAQLENVQKSAGHLRPRAPRGSMPGEALRSQVEREKRRQTTAALISSTRPR